MNEGAAERPLHSPEAEAAALVDAIDYLDSYREGLLEFDDQRVPVKFVDEPESGRLIASLPVAAMLASHVVLYVPEEGLDVMQLLVSVEEIGESAATDRWMIYHGEPEHVRWGAMWLDSARLGVWVFDGEALTVPNCLHADQARLCRAANGREDDLRAACQRMLNMEVESPRCVGVDGRGLHVRGRFGVLRLGFESAVSDGDAAQKAIEALLAKG